MKIGEGMVSKIYLNNEVVSKQYFTPFDKYTDRSIQDHWNCEIEALKKLTGWKHFPTLISIDKEKKIIVMNYCGEPLTKENLPSNWKSQCVQIERVFKNCSIFHNDFIGSFANPVPPHHKNILVKDGIIYVVDFGMWTGNKSKDTNSITSIIQELSKKENEY